MESIEQVAVLGLGTMGPGMAQMFAAAGCRVRCYDELASARGTLHDRIRDNLRQMAEAGVGDHDSINSILSRVAALNTEEEAVGTAEFVVEAVREDLAVKQDLFARVESLVSPRTILASNTSGLPMTQIAAKMESPERAVVAHWFNPPHLVPVVEVVPGRKTSDQTIETTMGLLERIGKLPVRLRKELPGHLVDRIQIALYREVWDLLERGVASREDIDLAVRGSMGFRLAAIGPLQVCDFAGLDIAGSVFRHLVGEIRSTTDLPTVIRKLIDDENFGLKTGKGIYDYTPESATEKRLERDGRLLALARLLYSNGKENNLRRDRAEADAQDEDERARD